MALACRAKNNDTRAACWLPFIHMSSWTWLCPLDEDFDAIFGGCSSTVIFYSGNIMLTCDDVCVNAEVHRFLIMRQPKSLSNRDMRYLSIWNRNSIFDFGIFILNHYCICHFPKWQSNVKNRSRFCCWRVDVMFIWQIFRALGSAGEIWLLHQCNNWTFWCNFPDVSQQDA